MIDRYNFNISTNSTVDLLGTYTSSSEVRFETILFCGQHKCLIWWVYVLVFWVFHSPKTRGVVYLCNEKPEFRNILGAWVVRCTHVSDQVSLKSVTCHVSHLPGALMDALLNPIENIWANLKHRIRKNVKPRNKEELVQGIMGYWNELTDEKCQRYIQHVHKVIPAVIANGGGPSGY